MNYIAGYTDFDDRILSKSLPVIIFGDHTRIFKFIDFPFAIGADGTKILFPCIDGFDPKFLYYYFLNLDIPSKGYNRHFKLLKEKLVIRPSLSEQQRIATVLSTVRDAKEKTEAVINSAIALKKSLMRHLFTYGAVPLSKTGEVVLKETEIGEVPEHWEVVRLGDVVEKTSQKDLHQTPDVRFKYVDVTSISNETMNIIDYKVYYGKNAPSRARKIIKRNDVIFATVRPTLKRIALIKDEFDGEICSTAFCVLKAINNKIHSKFIYYLIQRNHFILELGKIQRGASYPAVTDSDVKNQKIHLPPLPEQQYIAEILSAVDKKIEVEKNKKKAGEALFKTLLNNLLTGKLRVKDLEIT